MPKWYFQNFKFILKIIRSNLFSNYPELMFGFSTKLGGVSPEPYGLNLGLNTGDEHENVLCNRRIFFEALGINEDEVSFQKQVHSTVIKYSPSPQHLGECDALFTDKSKNYLAVSVADCVPVFLYDPHRKIIAGIHSGWKGSAGTILALTINELRKRFDVDPAKLVAYIGPCISAKNYEVGEEVAKLFDDEFLISSGEKIFLDLKKQNYSQLINCGLHRNNIEVSEHCTFDERDLLHSYRRDRERSGRMFGVIGIR